MEKLKVMTVVGTRPEIIRLSATMNLLDTSGVINHIIVHTGQNYDYELNEIFFKDLELRKPDYFLNAVGTNSIETVGKILIEIEKVLEKEKPDAFLILGDTNSCLCAIAAKKRKIPIFHMEAGNRCFDQRVPEETNRKIVDHISDINLTYSEIAREYLIKEGIYPEYIIKIGSPMFEVLANNKNKIDKSQVLKEFNLAENGYFLISAHREENINSSNFDSLISIMNKLAEMYKIPVIVSTHPRTRKMIDSKKVKLNPLVTLNKPLGFCDYVKLQKCAKAVLSDSGTISEETSILDLKSLNIREAHERPEAMVEASVMMVGLNEERIIQGIKYIENNPSKQHKIVDDYNVHNVSEKVVKIIISYVDYVNRFVWRKI